MRSDSNRHHITVTGRSSAMADVETKLRKLLEKIIRELNYTSPDISIRELNSGGANFTSTLFVATVTSPGHATLNLFAKAAIVNEKMREVLNESTLFRTENFFYTKLAKIYNDLQVKHEIPFEDTIDFPKFFGSTLTEKEEVVVLEDLAVEGYEAYSRLKAVDWEHMAVTTQTLARFHALSFAYRKEYPDKFKRALEELKLDTTVSDDPAVLATEAKMMHEALQVVEEENRGKLVKFLSMGTAREEFIKFKTPLSTPVICHGDFRISNLMFRRRHGKLEAVAVDYQILHPGSPAVDLLCLEFMGTDEPFRRQNHQRMLDHYFQELTLALTRLDIDVNEVYPRETFDAEFREMLPRALRFSTYVLPLVTLESNRAPTLGRDADVKDLAHTPSQLFAERFSGIVNDCVRWGVL